MPELGSTQARVFDAWAVFMLRHRVLVLVATAAVTGLLGWRASQLPLMTALSDMIPPTTPGIVAYHEARERFGGDEAALVGLEADDHFTDAGIERLRRVSERLEAHPFVERVFSFASAEQMWLDVDGQALHIEPYVREGRTPEQVKQAVLADDLLAGLLVSKDARLVLLQVQFVPNTEQATNTPGLRREMLRRTRGFPGAEELLQTAAGAVRLLEVSKREVAGEVVDWLVEAGYPRERIHAVGFPILLNQLLADAARNLKLLFPLTILVIFLVLVVLLRRPIDVALPLLCVAPAVVWAVAIGGTLFGRISVVTSIAPLMVLVVGVSDVVHLVTQFRHELARGFERDQAIRVAFAQVGAACALTSVTTFIGFGSMMLLPLPMSRELGVFAGLGVVAAFFLSFILTPIFLSFTKDQPERAERDAKGMLSPILRRVGRWVGPNAKAIVAAGAVVTAVVVVLVLQVRIENSLTRKLAPGHPSRRAVEFVEAQLGGSAEIELLIDGGEEGALKDPAVLAGLRALQDELVRDPDIAGSHTIADLLARMHELLAPDLATKSPLPDSRELVAQYLLLFEMSGGGDLDRLVDPTRRYARGVIRGVNMTAEEVIAMADRVDAHARRLLPASVTVQSSGLGLMAARLGPPTVVSSLKGLGGALAVITVLVSVLFGSLRVGILSLLPNILPVALALLAVSALFEQVDIDTLTYLAVCVGIAVDDTIHFLSRYRIERHRGHRRSQAVQATLEEAGHGILRTSLILMAGFSVLTFGDYQPIASSGVLLPVTLGAAVLLDLTLVPAMAELGLLEPREPRRPAPPA